jgi:hypothetical protein
MCRQMQGLKLLSNTDQDVHQDGRWEIFVENERENDSLPLVSHTEMACLVSGHQHDS